MNLCVACTHYHVSSCNLLKLWDLSPSVMMLEVADMMASPCLSCTHSGAQHMGLALFHDASAALLLHKVFICHTQHHA